MYMHSGKNFPINNEIETKIISELSLSIDDNINVRDLFIILKTFTIKIRLAIYYYLWKYVSIFIIMTICGQKIC